MSFLRTKNFTSVIVRLSFLAFAFEEKDWYFLQSTILLCSRPTLERSKRNAESIERGVKKVNYFLVIIT